MAEENEQKRKPPSDPYHAFDESWGPTRTPARKEPLMEYRIRPLPNVQAKWSVLGVVVWTAVIFALIMVLLYAGAAITQLFSKR